MEEATKGSLQKADQPGPRQKQSRKFRILSPSPPLESTLAVEVVPDVTEENAGECELGPTVQEPGQEWKIPKTKEECDRLVRALFTPPPSSSTRVGTGGSPTPSSPLTLPPSEPTTTTSDVSPAPLTGSDIFPFLDDVPTRVPDDGEVTVPKRAGAHDANSGATNVPDGAEVGRYITTWAPQGESRGAVIIPSEAVDKIYAKSKDILDRPATRQLCLLLAVQAKLHAGKRTVIWPSYTPNLSWLEADMNRLRRFLRLLNEQPELTVAGQYACQECAGGRRIGHLRVPCVYDPATMDGCVGCKTRNESRHGVCCRFDVQAVNPECVRWDKEKVEREQAAFETLPPIVPEDAPDLLAIIKRHADRAEAFSIASQVERFFSPDYGLMANVDTLLAARSSLRMSTCKREPYLVWSWRWSVDQEQRAYEAVTTRIKEWNHQLADKRLKLLAETQPESALVIREALMRLVSSFEDGGEFMQALEVYQAARDARNERPQYFGIDIESEQD